MHEPLAHGAAALHYKPSPLIRVDGLAQRLHDERVRAGIKQATIAGVSDHVRMTVYRYEKGEQLPSLKLLAAAERLGMSVYAVLSGEPADCLAAREFRFDLEGFPRRLRAERERLGLDQGELASLMQISRPTQTAYENGYSLPALEYLCLAQEVGVDVRYLLSSQRSALLLGWSDSHRLAGALRTAASLLTAEEWRSPIAVADMVMQILIPRGNSADGGSRRPFPQRGAGHQAS